MNRNNKKKAILEAAIRVVAKDGSNHLTIDAVAAEASLSKGGVLYHFTSKEALLQGMVDQLIDTNESRIGRQPDSLSRFAASLHLDDPMTTEEEQASLAILAAVAENPDLIEAPKRYMAELLATAFIDVRPEQEQEALLLFLANEGLRYLRILNLDPLTAQQSAAVIAFMRVRAEEI